MDDAKKYIEDMLTGNNPTQFERMFKLAQAHYEQEMFNPPVKYDNELKGE